MVKILYGDRIGKQGRIAVGCSAFILDKCRQEVLLVQRADNGRWAVPGGYMEAGESLTEACAREVREETGLEVQIQDLIAIYDNPHMLLQYDDGNKWQLIVFHFRAERIGGELRGSAETTAVNAITLQELGHLNMGPFDHQRVRDGLQFSGQVILHHEYRI